LVIFLRALFATYYYYYIKNAKDNWTQG